MTRFSITKIKRGILKDIEVLFKISCFCYLVNFQKSLQCDLIVKLYDMQFSHVKNKQQPLKPPFPTPNGMKHCCVLDSALFMIFSSTMMKWTPEEMDNEKKVYICTCSSGNLYSLK